jgi:hypothetical protein
MSIAPTTNPLTAALGSLGRPASAPGAGAAGTQPAGVRPGASPLARPAAAPARRSAPALAASAPASLPAEAPAGTDPALWSVLTGEERAYFAKAAASGPLTYGRIAAGVNAMQPSAPASVRGGRLDVRA